MFARVLAVLVAGAGTPERLTIDATHLDASFADLPRDRNG